MKVVHRKKLKLILMPVIVQVRTTEVLSLDNDFQLTTRTFEGLKGCFRQECSHFSFRGMKQPGVILLPLAAILVHCKVTPQQTN